MKLDRLTLLSPFPIPLEGIGVIRPPVLSEVAKLGQALYNGYLNLLALSRERFLDMQGLPDQTEGSLFQLLTMNRDTRELLEAALGFFLYGEVQYAPRGGCFFVREENRRPTAITPENFTELCGCILQLNYLDKSGAMAGSPKNQRAARILAKLEAAKQRQRPKGNRKDLDLSNMISALCTQHNSYNLTNIWSMTVYQLYDQFFRQNYKNQLDVAMHWSAWGTEKFDFTQWFSNDG